MANFTYSQFPHHYAGSDSDRQSVGDPGHCEACVAFGHVKAHPSLGCGDVGCNSSHGAVVAFDGGPLHEADLFVADDDSGHLPEVVTYEADKDAALVAYVLVHVGGGITYDYDGLADDSETRRCPRVCGNRALAPAGATFDARYADREA